MKKGNVEAFYDELLIALWGYLGDKLKMPTSELMRDNIKAVLDRNGIPEEQTARLLETLDNCEYVKYSPDSGKASMKKSYDEAIDVINSLERSFKKIKTNEK